ncbi:MAG TPA: DUF4398 domain-containing protein, partial [Myxococcales bacterium]|nr:DUF4398 domain-containing protein [Myxococcales bacterium]
MSTVMTRRALQLAGLLGLGLLTACLAPVPPELIDARLAFDRAQASQTSTYAPEELARARRALNRAESEYQRAPRGRNARDLAYVAHRKVQIADSHARLEIAQQELARARQQLSDRQAMTASQLAEARARLQAQQDEQQRQQAAEMDRAQREAAERATREQAAQVEQLARAKEQLDESQRKMDAQQQQLQLRQQELDQARRDREQAEAARKEALAELERVAKVSEEQRGTVITLPGGLLFAPGQTVLSGDAQRALGQVAEALKAVPDQRVVIEGHT